MQSPTQLLTPWGRVSSYCTSTSPSLSTSPRHRIDTLRFYFVSRFHSSLVPWESEPPSSTNTPSRHVRQRL